MLVRIYIDNVLMIIYKFRKAWHKYKYSKTGSPIWQTAAIITIEYDMETALL